MSLYKKKYNKTPAGKLLNASHRKLYQSSGKGKKTKVIYKSSDEARKLIKADRRRSRKKHPNSYKCRDRTKYLIRIGDLIRPSNCDTCRLVCKPQGHHSDYNYPDVINWLCAQCHRDWHKLNTPLNRVSGIFTEKY